MANGLPNGPGSLVCKSGAKYVGAMKNGLKADKRATLTDEKGNIYVGGFKGDVKDGKGKTQPKGGQPKYDLWKKGNITKAIDEATFNK